MKKIVCIAVIMITAISLSAQQVNDPNAEVRTAKDFHGISVSNAFDVYLTQGNEEAVAVSAGDTRNIPNINVEVKAGILYITYDEGRSSWRGNKKLKAYVSFKQIDQLKISGACDVMIIGTLKADVLTINQSGASDLKQGKLDVNKLTVDLSGASDMSVSGRALQLFVEASGASEFKAYDLETDICNAQASGASDIKVKVNKELSAQASGASDVRYRGDGVIKDIRSSGASSVTKG